MLENTLNIAPKAKYDEDYVVDEDTLETTLHLLKSDEVSIEAFMIFFNSSILLFLIWRLISITNLNLKIFDVFIEMEQHIESFLSK